ncbi:MAG: phosphate ABC transporter permease subunit PstC [Peptococcaceae bacterium]|nr:phosphate ABC transporter permease subunit PstC [Peptococcaceae bacterium]
MNINTSNSAVKKTKNGFNAEKIVYYGLTLCALISVITTIAIVVTLLVETFSFFKEVSIFEFLTGNKWAPLFEPKHFGILPLLSGTLMVTVISGALAIPTGLASAIYLSEFASEKTRRIIKPTLEVLAGIPTVVYGFFAITFITPIIRYFFPEADFFNALSASIVMGIMLIPMVSSLSEDAMVAVPKSLREAGFALGSTRLEVATKIVVPAAFSGIIASFILALSRAIGETMIVALAAGASPKLTLNPLESIQTMTGYIVQVSLGDTPYGTIEYKTIFAVGMSLFVITFIMNIISQYIVKRHREG